MILGGYRGDGRGRPDVTRPSSTFKYSDEFVKELRELFPGFEDFEVMLSVSPLAIGPSIQSAVTEAIAEMTTLSNLSEKIATPEGVLELQRIIRWCESVNALHVMWRNETGM